MHRAAITLLSAFALAGCVDMEDEETFSDESQAIFTPFTLATWPPGDTSADSPRDVVRAGNYVYWSRGNTVQRIHIDGGSVLTYCAACGDPGAESFGIKVAVDTSYVYYLNWDADGGGWHAIKNPISSAEFPLYLGEAIPYPASPDEESPLLVAGGYLYYFARFPGVGARLYRFPTGGGSPQLVQDFVTPYVQPWGLAQDTSFIYAGSGGIIYKFDKATLARTTLTTSAALANNFVVSGTTYLYFTEVYSSKIRRLNRTLSSAQTPTTLYTDPTPGKVIGSLAVDGTNLYWTLFGTGASDTSELKTKPISGGSASVLWTVPSNIQWIDDVVWYATGPSLYWGQGDALVKALL